MKAESSEIKIEVCFQHKDRPLGNRYPGYLFNVVKRYKASKCGYEGCCHEATFILIGLKVPDSVGDLKQKSVMPRFIRETFTEAKEILREGPAEEALANYLLTRIDPINPQAHLVKRLTQHHAILVLERLKIDPWSRLTDRQIGRVLRELGMYGKDYK